MYLVWYGVREYHIDTQMTQVNPNIARFAGLNLPLSLLYPAMGRKVSEMEREAQIYRAYAEWIGQGGATRLDAALHFGVCKSTAAYHLDKAVKAGLLVRVYDWCDNNQTGWVYRGAEAPMELPFYESESEYRLSERDAELLETPRF